MTSKRKIKTHSFINNAKWLLIEKLIRIFLSFFVSIWLANYLGTENFGLLNYALSFTLIFTSMLSLGLDKYIPKEIILHPNNENEIIIHSIHLRLLGSIIMLFLVNSIGYFFQNGNPLFSWMVLIISIGYSFKIFDVIMYWFEAKVISLYSLIAQSTALILSSLIKICFILMQLDLIYFGFAIMLEYIIQALLLLVLFLKFNPIKEFFNFSIEKMFNIIRITWPLIFASLLADIYSKVDIIMLGKIYSNEAVGIYTAATKISSSWLFIPVVLATAYFPALLKEKKNRNYKKFNELTLHLLNFLFYLGFFAALLCTFYSTNIINLLFNEQYVNSAQILIIHIWGAIFISMSSINNRIMVANNLNKLLLSRSLIGFISNIILNLILIPKYGGNGAAIATVISLFISLFLFNYFNPKTKRLFFLQINSINPLLIKKTFIVLSKGTK